MEDRMEDRRHKSLINWPYQSKHSPSYFDASNDVLAAAEGWAHCGHPSMRDCRQRAGT